MIHMICALYIIIRISFLQCHKGYAIKLFCFKKTNMPAGCDMGEELLNQGNNYWIYEKGKFTGKELFIQYYQNYIMLIMGLCIVV